MFVLSDNVKHLGHRLVTKSENLKGIYIPRLVESFGLDEITIMDSAGTMMPHQVSEYVKAMVAAVDIPVAFHGHNNLGLSVANAIAAAEAGGTVFDCGLLGMARSAGNCATELLVATFQRFG